MLPHVPPAALAKAKALAVVAAALTAGSVGGIAALSQVQRPAAGHAKSGAVHSRAAVAPVPSSSASAAPTTSSPPAPTATAAPTVGVVTPAGTAPTGAAPVQPTATPTSSAANHGGCVSSTARSGADAGHADLGTTVANVAGSDCGKPTPKPTHSRDPEPHATVTVSPGAGSSDGHGGAWSGGNGGQDTGGAGGDGSGGGHAGATEPGGHGQGH